MHLDNQKKYIYLMLGSIYCFYMQVCILTSHYNGSGLLSRVSHIVAGHAAVDPRLI